MESVKVSFDAPLLWSDGDTFEGYLMFLTVLPQAGQNLGKNNKLLSKNPVLARSNPPISAPLWHTLPIKGGNLLDSARVWKTSAYAPKGCKYFLYLFDKTGNKVDNVYSLPSEPLEIVQDYVVEIDPIVNGSTTGEVAEHERLSTPGVMFNLPVDMTNTFFLVRTLDGTNGTIEYAIKPINSLLIIDLTQDATGDRLVTYGSNFIDALEDITMTAGARSSQIFRSDGVNWLRVTPS